jgi:hypothetical protein
MGWRFRRLKFIVSPPCSPVDKAYDSQHRSERNDHFPLAEFEAHADPRGAIKALSSFKLPKSGQLRAELGVV